MTETDDIISVVKEYRQWMKDRTVLRSAKNGWIEVNAPFMDRHNDGFQIYVRKVNDAIEMTVT